MGRKTLPIDKDRKLIGGIVVTRWVDGDDNRLTQLEFRLIVLE